MLKHVAVLSIGLLLQSADLSAQEPFNIAVRVERLALLFPQLYGRDGLIVDSRATLTSGENHSAHFDSAFQSEFVQFGAALTGKLVSVPLPSLASGFTYEFDPSLGVFSRNTQSFGPIMAERAETIGANRTSFGVAFEHSGFDTIEGLNLDNVPGVFTHDDFELGDRRIFTAFGSARGIGDLTVRLKSRVWKGATSGVALGLDLRVPTGDEENLLGAGAPGVKPFMAWSA